MADPSSQPASKQGAQVMGRIMQLDGSRTCQNLYDDSRRVHVIENNLKINKGCASSCAQELQLSQSVMPAPVTIIRRGRSVDARGHARHRARDLGNRIEAVLCPMSSHGRRGHEEVIGFKRRSS